MSDTIAAISTGAQISAIGIVRLSGDDAINIVSALFHPFSGKKMDEADDRKLIFGDLCDRNGELLDRCLCTVSRAPHSYTGEDTAELQCHGSPVLLRAVLEELFASGARQALPGEFSKRAFLNGCMDLTSAESKVTYDEIREYVMAQPRLHVTNLNIAQIKRKCGIIERENYNLPKSEDSKQPNCTKEKEDAIKEAFRHFGMI